jgi:hypothetical protein
VEERAVADHIIQPFLYRVSKTPLANALNKSVCTTEALHTFIFRTVDECKFEEEALAMQDVYKNILLHGASAIRTQEDGMMRINGVELKIDGSCQVTDFMQCLETLHKTVVTMLAAAWMSMCDAGWLTSPVTGETSSLVDVALFAMMVFQHRWNAGHKPYSVCAKTLLQQCDTHWLPGAQQSQINGHWKSIFTTKQLPLEPPQPQGFAKKQRENIPRYQQMLRGDLLKRSGKFALYP